MESQKRTATDRDNLLDGIRTVLLDVEGTTTPLSFVQETVTPYVKENLRTYLESHWDNEECQQNIESLRKQAACDKEAGVEGVVDIEGSDKEKETVLDSVVNNVMWQTESNRNAACLSQLQNQILREAYKTGKIQGSLFSDVAPALKSWNVGGKKVFLYSSGSAEVQKLLFGHSNCGDLREQVAGHFDAEIGSKDEKESYVKIAKQTECNPDEILFLTDVPDEARAAAEAGLNVCIVEREGNAPLSEEDQQNFNSISSFAELEGSGAEGDKIAKTDDVAADSTNGEPEQGQGDAPTEPQEAEAEAAEAEAPAE